MALSYAHGAVQWLTTDALNTTFPVSGLGFRPKVIRAFVVGLQSATDAASQAVHWRSSVGFALSATDRRCMASQSQDAAATQVCTVGYRNDALVATVTNTPAVDGLLDVSSFDSDGFTLIVDDVTPVNLTVFWEAWGGSDIVDASLIEVAEPAGTGNASYITGFRPDVVMFAGVQGTAAPNTVTRNDASVMVGAASGPRTDQQWHCWVNDDDASATTDTDRYGRAGECLGLATVGGGNPSARAQLVALTGQGFTLNWIARATANRRYLACAIKGGAWDAGSFTITGNSGGATAAVVTRAQSGKSFQPVGISFAGIRNTQSAAGTSATNAFWAVGMAKSTSDRRSMGLYSLDANATAANIATTLEYDACLSFPSTAGAADNAMDLSAVNADGFTAVIDVAGAGVANQWVGYLACGSKVYPPEHQFNNYHRPISEAAISGDVG